MRLTRRRAVARNRCSRSSAARRPSSSISSPGPVAVLHDEVVCKVGLEDRGMDVACPADRRRVAEPLGDELDRADDVALRLGLATRTPRARASALRREHRAGPRAEVLGRELLARDLAQVLVDVGRVDRARRRRPRRRTGTARGRAGRWQRLDDPREPAVARCSTSCALAALAAELGSAAVAPSIVGVLVAQRRQRRTSRSAARTPRCRRGSASSRAAARRPRAPSRAAGPRRARSLRDARADRRQRLRRTRPCGRTSSRRAPRASAGGSGTACGLRASRPVAWMWPRGVGQIQTSRPRRRDRERADARERLGVADRLAVRGRGS